MIKHSREELMKKLSDTATLDIAAYEAGNALWKWVSLKERHNSG